MTAIPDNPGGGSASGRTADREPVCPQPAAPRGSMDDVARLAATATGASGAVVSVAGDDGVTLIGRSGALDSAASAAGLDPLSVVCQRVADSGEELVVDEAPGGNGAAGACGGEGERIGNGIGSYVAVPIRGPGGDAVGAVALASDEARGWGGEELEALRAVATVAAGRVAGDRELRRLRESESHYRRLTEHSPSAVYQLDADGRITEMNAACLKLLGRSAEEALGTHFTEVLAPDGIEIGWDVFDRIISEGHENVTVEIPLLRPSGEVRLARITAIGIEEQGRAVGIHGIAEDITEEIRVERERSLLLEILENSPDLVGVRTASGEDVWLNRAASTAARSVGAGQTRGRDTQTPHPDWAEQQLQDEAIPEAVARGHWQGESAIVSPDGGEVPVTQLVLAHRDDSGEVTHFSTVMRDLSGLKAREAALRESEERHRGVVEQSLVGIYVMDGERFEYVNPTFARIFGYTTDELLEAGRRLWDVVAPEDEELVRDRIRDRLDGGRSLEPYLFRGVRKDGRRIWLEAHGSMVRSNGRGVIAGLLLDVTERREAEAAVRRQREELEESQRFLRGVLDSLPNQVAVIDAGGRILAVNRAWERFAEENGGDPESTGAGANYLAACDAASGPGAALARDSGEGIRSVIAGTAPEFSLEYPCHSPDRERWFVVRACRFDGEGPVRVVVSHEDITERVRREAEIAAREAEYRQRFDANEAVQLILEPGSGRILDANPAARSFYGYEELTGLRITDLNVSTDPDELRRRMREVVGEGGGHFFFRHRLSDGQVRDVEVHTSVLRDREGERLYSIIHDVTDRRRAEEALKVSEERFRSLFEHNPNAMVLAGIDGEILEVNPATERLLGFARGELAGERLTRLWPEAERDRLLDQFGRAAQSGPATYEHDMVARDGETLEVRVTSVPVYRGAEVEAVFGVVEDVGEQKRLEAQLQHAVKMQAVGRLAGGVAHDFNNLLTVINGHAEMVLEEIQEGDPLREDLEEIRRTGERAGALTRQLLVFSRRDSVRPRALDLNDVIAGTDRMLRRVVGEDVELATSLDEDLWTTKIDRGQLEQVLMNLVINARDAVPEGGRIHVSTRNVSVSASDPPAPVPVLPGPYVELEVADTGTGMDEETVAQIFEPFFTTKETGKGTGLGLATAYGIVSQAEGAIWAESTPGEGTCMRVLLPRTAEAPDLTPPEEPERRERPNGRVVLLVEDEVGVRTLSRRVLERHGHTVLEAGDPRQALQLVESGADFDLLLTDIVMPGMNGRELARRVREVRPDTAVGFMSGYVEEAARNQGIEQVQAVLLEKPFTPAKLCRFVDGLLREEPSALC